MPVLRLASRTLVLSPSRSQMAVPVFLIYQRWTQTPTSRDRFLRTTVPTVWERSSFLQSRSEASDQQQGHRTPEIPVERSDRSTLTSTFPGAVARLCNSVRWLPFTMSIDFTQSVIVGHGIKDMLQPYRVP